MFEKRYKIILFRMQYKIAQLIKSVQMKNITPTIRIDNKSYPIDIESPAYVTKKQVIFLIDIDSSSQITLDSAKAIINPTDLDLIMGQKLIADLARGVTDSTKDKIINFLIGAVFGALVGGIIAILYYTAKIDEILQARIPIVIY
jgi:hypothetical protein